jgi:hypothetical protein
MLQPHIVDGRRKVHPFICHCHLHLFATRTVGLRNSAIGFHSVGLCSTILTILRTSLESYRQSNHRLFLKDRGRLQVSSALRHGPPSHLPMVNVDAPFIYCVLGNDASLESLHKDRVTVANDMLSYLFNDPEVKLASFQCYLYHNGFSDAHNCRSWGRNCWYSPF